MAMSGFACPLLLCSTHFAPRHANLSRLSNRLKSNVNLAPFRLAVPLRPSPREWIGGGDDFTVAMNQQPELKRFWQGGRFPNWNDLYQKQSVETMPWYKPTLLEELAQELESRNIRSGTFLDIGTGPGTQANELAKMGFTVTGTDFPAAVEAAKQKFPDVTFVADDILNSTLSGEFDCAMDRGCFHVLPPEKRHVYIDTVTRLLKKDGLLFLSAFSIEEPERDIGPYRFSESDIREIFGSAFDVISTRLTQSNEQNGVIRNTVFAVMKRL